MGMMTPDALRRLLMLQWERKPSLADVLVQMRILSQDRVDDELLAYRNDVGRRNLVIKRTIPSLPSYPSDEEAPTLSESEAFSLMI